MIAFVDLKKQYAAIKEEVNAAIQDCLDNTSFISGKRVQKLEEDFAKASGAGFGVAASSGTTALHLSLAALGVGPGDEVITVSNTFIATTEAVAQTGAKLKFVDIDEKTYNMDVTQLEAAITEKTKAVIPVHLYGQPVDIAPVLDVAKKHNLKVIFDAAQAHLAEYKNQPIGAFGDAACYSFYPGKNLGAYGDAGMVLTNDKDLADKMKMLSNHGRIDKYEHLMDGYNYRMDEIQAAVLNVKLKYLKGWTDKRRQAAALYDELFKDSGVVTPYAAPGRKHVYHLYVVRVRNRADLQKELKNQGIATGIHYPIPLHQQKVYESLRYPQGSLPVTEKCAGEILSLPMHPDLTEEDIRFVAEQVKKFTE